MKVIQLQCGGIKPETAMLKIKQVAAMLGVSVSSVRVLVARGVIKADRSLRHALIPIEEVQKFISLQK